VRAATRSEYGSPEVISVRDDVPKPEPGPRDLLVRVYATTVNRTDCGVLTGKPFIFRFFVGYPTPPAVLGTDFAGVVESIGAEVTAFKPGDRVLGFNDEGLQTQAEYVRVSDKQAVALIPEGVSFEQAAASIEGAHYAYNFLSKVNLKKGDRVLVNGATGAIGSAAVQMLKHLGAEITAVCGTEGLKVVRAWDPANVIDFRQQDFTKVAEGPFPFVFDAVGKSTFGACKPLMTPKGIYVSSELGPRNENPWLALVTPFLGRRKVVFPLPLNIRRSLAFILPLLASGEFKPLIDRTYRPEEIADAYRLALAGEKLGNLVVRWA
jgi:NADPH:quinone reductase-like Zn-dependent oxidoreductase